MLYFFYKKLFFYRKEDEKMNSVVVNFFGGPCAGKTVLSWNLAVRLKKEGILAEVVPEYAKILVYEGRGKALKNQRYVFAKQEFAISNLITENQVVIVDSPILLSLIYQKDNTIKSFVPFALEVFNSYNNLNYFVKRIYSYQPQGRVQKTEDEAVFYDKAIKKLLNDNGIPYKEIVSDDKSIDLILNDILTKINEG